MRSSIARVAFLTVVVIVLAMVGAACSSGSEGPADTREDTQPSGGQDDTANMLLQPDEIPLIIGPVSEDGVQAIFATSGPGSRQEPDRLCADIAQ